MVFCVAIGIFLLLYLLAAWRHSACAEPGVDSVNFLASSINRDIKLLRDRLQRAGVRIEEFAGGDTVDGRLRDIQRPRQIHRAHFAFKHEAANDGV